MKKILNWLMVETAISLKARKAWGWPTHLQIEPTNHCNIACALCPVSKGLDRPSGHMRFKTFQRILDETGDYVFLLLLWGWGEPFMKPGVYEMIAYSKNKDVQIISSTNGHIFSKRKNAEKVVRSGLNSLIFAVDGITQQTYQCYRQGGNLEKVLEGIRNVVETKQRLGSKTPLINLRFIRHRQQ